ncbi:MAG: DMT family transporter [Candidatus Nanohaloarchaeota archaeon]|nr:DMT family transporter [Candidatus Nanohaloarchaeota archaeon]
MIWVILALLSAIIVSVLIYLSKKEIQRHESIEYATTMRFWMFALSLPLLVLANTYITTKALYLLYLASWFNVLGYWFLFKSVKHMDLSVVSPFLNLEVLFILLFAWVFYGESLSFLSLIGLFILLSGLLCLETTRKNIFKGIKKMFKEKYHWVVVLSSLFYALFKVISRYVLKYENIDLWFYLVITNFFVIINFFIAVYVIEKLNPFYVLKSKIKSINNLPLLVALNFSQMVNEYAAYKIAPKAVFVSALKSTYTFFSELWDFISRKNKSYKKLIISGIVVMGAIIALLF